MSMRVDRFAMHVPDLGSMLCISGLRRHFRNCRAVRYDSGDPVICLDFGKRSRPPAMIVVWKSTTTVRKGFCVPLVLAARTTSLPAQTVAGSGNL
jgi:hypothetical protein